LNRTGAKPAGASFPIAFSIVVKVCFDVAVGGLDTLMTEPECDYSRIYPGLEQMHGGGVPNHVWRYPLISEAGARRRRAVSEPAQQKGSAVAGKTVSTCAGKCQTAESVAEFLEPSSPHLRCFGP